MALKMVGALAVSLIAGTAAAGDKFTVDSVNPSFFPNNVLLYFDAGSTNFTPDPACTHPYAERMVSIDWAGANDAERQGRALQVAAVISYGAVGRPLTIRAIGCTSNGAPRVFSIN